MTPVEVAHRALRAHAGARRALGPGCARRPCRRPTSSSPAKPLGRTRRRRRRGALRRRRRAHRRRPARHLRAARDADLGMPPRWNRDPKTGIEAPLAFGKLLDYRDPDLVGDIKYLWEPNRHLHLVTLAQAYALTGERELLSTRSPSSSRAGSSPARTAAARTGRARSRRASASSTGRSPGSCVGGRCARRGGVPRAAGSTRSTSTRTSIRHWFSAHSSANNHLIGEAAGLFIAGITWPHWPRDARVGGSAKQILEREALAQNAPDGVNREQAVWYQQFVLDMLVLALLAGKANGEWFSRRLRVAHRGDDRFHRLDHGRRRQRADDRRRRRRLRWCASTRTPGYSPFRSALAHRRAALPPRRLQAEGGRARRQGALAARRRTPTPQFERARRRERRGCRCARAFPEGGYYVLGCRLRHAARDARRGRRRRRSATPSIAAHGHADALSFTLSVGGREFLIDPGTYAYHTQERWRQYFRGTAAHNTRAHRRPRPVRAGRQLHVAEASARRLQPVALVERRRTASRAGTTATCASTIR